MITEAELRAACERELPGVGWQITPAAPACGLWPYAIAIICGRTVDLDSTARASLGYGWEIRWDRGPAGHRGTLEECLAWLRLDLEKTRAGIDRALGGKGHTAPGKTGCSRGCDENLDPLR